MKKLISHLLACATILASVNASAEGFVEGVPVRIQKTDYGTLHLVFIQLNQSFASTGCDSNYGLVVLDSNESAKAALTFAIAALASGKKFSCYVRDNQCSAYTGSAQTFPICDIYPALVN